MKTKKLRSVIFAFILSAFFLTNTIKAANTYVYCGAGAVTALSSWHLTTCAGAAPASFTGAGDTWNFSTAGSYTLTATWILGSNAKVNLGPGGQGVTLATGGFVIKTAGATNITLKVFGASTLDVGISTLFVVGNKLTLNASTAGATVNYSVAGATVANVVYSNLSFTANNTLNIATITGNFTNSASATINSAVLTVANVINSGTIVMGSGGTNLAISGDLNNTGTISLVSSSNLTANGTITSLGTVSGDGTGYLINAGTDIGTLTMDQATVGTSNSMFEIQNTGSGGITLANGLCIAVDGDITPVSGTIDAGSGLLTLLAGQGKTGAIGDCSGGTFIAASIISKVVHNPSGNSTNWTTMGVAGVTNANFQQWRSGFPITCASCLDGCCPGGTAFASVTSYDETLTGGGDFSNAAHYVNLASDASTINNGQGYWVYMGNTSPGTATGAEAITVSGAPQQGPVTLNFTFTNASNGSNLLANPFPSPISWSTVMSNNPGAFLDGTAYIYNAADGSFGTIAANGSASSTYGLNDDVIPAGMAFFVQATATGSILLDETVKSVGGTQDLQRMSSAHSAQSIAQIPKFSIEVQGAGAKSRTMIQFDSRAVAGIDNIADAAYLLGTEPIKITSQIAGKDFSINGLPDVNQNYNIPVRMAVTTSGSYQVNAIDLQKMPSGVCLMLHDNSDNSDYDLRQGPHSITINSTDVGARFVLSITSTTLSITANTVEATCPSASNGYITVTGNNAGPWNYTWKDANNNIVKTSLNKSTADTLAGLNTGGYSVDVNTVGSCDNATQSFVMNVAAPQTLATTLNSMQASCSTANDGYITAVGNNAGPWNYTWKDADNNIIKTSSGLTMADTLDGLNGGIYSVEIMTVGGCDQTTESYTLAVPASPTSVFSTTSSTVNVSTLVTFTNSSTNAGDFWWTFGDGSNSNLQNPSYTYNAIGTYTVTLYAFNAACSDTSSSQQVIIVQSNTSGIATVANGDIILSKDQSGAYVKFNYAAQTRVNINVYNALGQVILANQNHLVTGDKIYLNLDHAKDEMIFISIGNLDKNTQVTKKLYNN